MEKVRTGKKIVSTRNTPGRTSVTSVTTKSNNNNSIRKNKNDIDLVNEANDSQEPINDGCESSEMKICENNNNTSDNNEIIGAVTRSGCGFRSSTIAKRAKISASPPSSAVTTTISGRGNCSSRKHKSVNKLVKNICSDKDSDRISHKSTSDGINTSDETTELADNNEVKISEHGGDEIEVKVEKRENSCHSEPNDEDNKDDTNCEQKEQEVNVKSSENTNDNSLGLMVVEKEGEEELNSKTDMQKTKKSCERMEGDVSRINSEDKDEIVGVNSLGEMEPELPPVKQKEDDDVEIKIEASSPPPSKEPAIITTKLTVGNRQNKCSKSGSNNSVSKSSLAVNNKGSNEGAGREAKIAPMVFMNNLPYMGELTFDTRPRRGRKPKKADICHLISKNYGIQFPNSAPVPPATQKSSPSSNRTVTPLTITPVVATNNNDTTTIVSNKNIKIKSSRNLGHHNKNSSRSELSKTSVHDDKRTNIVGSSNLNQITWSPPLPPDLLPLTNFNPTAMFLHQHGGSRLHSAPSEPPPISLVKANNHNKKISLFHPLNYLQEQQQLQISKLTNNNNNTRNNKDHHIMSYDDDDNEDDEDEPLNLCMRDDQSPLPLLGPTTSLHLSRLNLLSSSPLNLNISQMCQMQSSSSPSPLSRSPSLQQQSKQSSMSKSTSRNTNAKSISATNLFNSFNLKRNNKSVSQQGSNSRGGGGDGGNRGNRGNSSKATSIKLHTVNNDPNLVNISLQQLNSNNYVNSSNHSAVTITKNHVRNLTSLPSSLSLSSATGGTTVRGSVKDNSSSSSGNNNVYKLPSVQQQQQQNKVGGSRGGGGGGGGGKEQQIKPGGNSSSKRKRPTNGRNKRGNNSGSHQKNSNNGPTNYSLGNLLDPATSTSPFASSSNNPAEVSICKFKFTGGAKPCLQEKKMLSVDSTGNFRFYSDKPTSSPNSNSTVNTSTSSSASHNTATTSTSSTKNTSSTSSNSKDDLHGTKSASNCSGNKKIGIGEIVTQANLPRSAKSMSMCMPSLHTSTATAPTNNNNSNSSSNTSTNDNIRLSVSSPCRKNSSAAMTSNNNSVLPHNDDFDGDDCTSSSDGGTTTPSSMMISLGHNNDLDGSTTLTSNHHHRHSNSSSKLAMMKRKRRTRKSVARENLEKTFKEKGFLIQTQQLESAEGATYCKFRQLRKFTRYLFRSWKDYLPDNVKANTPPGATGPGPNNHSGQIENECGINRRLQLSSSDPSESMDIMDDDDERDVEEEESDDGLEGVEIDGGESDISASSPHTHLQYHNHHRFLQQQQQQQHQEYDEEEDIVEVDDDDEDVINADIGRNCRQTFEEEDDDYDIDGGDEDEDIDDERS